MPRLANYPGSSWRVFTDAEWKHRRKIIARRCYEDNKHWINPMRNEERRNATKARNAALNVRVTDRGEDKLQS